jgi:hypothetical protein
MAKSVNEDACSLCSGIGTLFQGRNEPFENSKQRIDAFSSAFWSGQSGCGVEYELGDMQVQ